MGLKLSLNNKQSGKKIYVLKKLNLVKTIKNLHSQRITSICVLKDRRLVSASFDGSMIVYDESYEFQKKIEKGHDGAIFSLCVLRNGCLVSGSKDTLIKIWRINGSDFEPAHTLKGHTNNITKVLELENGKLCSSSLDTTIKLWDNNTFQCIISIKAYDHSVVGIIEMNDFIVSACNLESLLKIWNKSTLELVKYIADVPCNSLNGMEKLNSNTLLVGGHDTLSVVDMRSFKANKIKDETSESVDCLRVIKNDVVLFGTGKGEICYYNPLSNQIIYREKFHNDYIVSLIGTEDDKLISFSNDQTINIYKPIITSKNKSKASNHFIS